MIASWIGQRNWSRSNDRTDAPLPTQVVQRLTTALAGAQRRRVLWKRSGAGATNSVQPR